MSENVPSFTYPELSHGEAERKLEDFRKLAAAGYAASMTLSDGDRLMRVRSDIYQKGIDGSVTTLDGEVLDAAKRVNEAGAHLDIRM